MVKEKNHGKHFSPELCLPNCKANCAHLLTTAASHGEYKRKWRLPEEVSHLRYQNLNPGQSDPKSIALGCESLWESDKNPHMASASKLLPQCHLVYNASNQPHPCNYLYV
jgi:hypothetical protein